jgi:NAD(P)-dependent dehydrogenase (short-subunit alcohol dehydrogenase family)
MVFPKVRGRQAGVIVNVTLSVTLASVLFAAACTGSKTTVEGFTGSLALELSTIGARVKLFEPGYGPSTRFTENGTERMQGLIPDLCPAELRSTSRRRKPSPTRRTWRKPCGGLRTMFQTNCTLRPAPTQSRSLARDECHSSLALDFVLRLRAEHSELLELCSEALVCG